MRSIATNGRRYGLVSLPYRFNPTFDLEHIQAIQRAADEWDL